MIQDVDRRIEKLDRTFDLVLLLASIISATLFQFISSIPYSEKEVMVYERVLRVAFKIFLIPIVLTIFMWIPTQLARRQTLGVLLLKTCAWTYLLSMLSLYLVWITLLGFAAQIPLISHMAIVTMVVTVPIGGVLLRFVMVEYQMTMNLEVFRTRSWLYRQVLAVIIAVVLAEISIFAAFL